MVWLTLYISTGPGIFLWYICGNVGSRQFSVTTHPWGLDHSELFMILPGFNFLLINLLVCGKSLECQLRQYGLFK